jgi:hypothetical protein
MRPLRVFAKVTCFIRQFDGYPHHVVTNVQNHSILGYLGGVSVPLDIWPLVHQSLLLSLSPAHPKTAAGCLVIRQYECPIPGKDSQRPNCDSRPLASHKENVEKCWKLWKALVDVLFTFFSKGYPQRKTWWTCSNMFQFRSPPRIRRHKFQLYVAAGGVCSHHRPCAQEIRYSLLRTHMDRKPAQRSVIETLAHQTQWVCY